MTDRKYSLGKNMRISRVILELKIKDVADRLKVSPSAISYLEKRQNDVLIIQYLKLLRKNKIDLNKLFE